MILLIRLISQKKSHNSHPCNFIWPLIIMMLISGCGTHEYRHKRAKLLYQQGQLLQTQGKTDEAVKKFERSLALARKEGFRAGIAHNLNELAIISTSRGEYEKARRLLRQAAQIYRSLDMHPEVSKALNNIAITYIKQGDMRSALATYNELLKWDKKTGNTLGQLVVLYNTGKIYDDYLGLPCRAKVSYESALDLAQALGHNDLAKKIRHHLSRLASICSAP